MLTDGVPENTERNICYGSKLCRVTVERAGMGCEESAPDGRV